MENEEIIKSNNDKGNPNHKPAGSPDGTGGQFTSYSSMSKEEIIERQKVNNNPKTTRIKRKVENKVPFNEWGLNSYGKTTKDGRYFIDMYLYTPAFERFVLSKIMEDTRFFDNANDYVLVENKIDDTAGIDCFCFLKSGHHLRVDLKTSFRGGNEISLGIRQTILDKEGKFNWYKNWLIDSSKKTTHYCFMDIDYLTSPEDAYEEVINGRNATDLVHHCDAYVVNRKKLLSFVEQSSGMSLEQFDDIANDMREAFKNTSIYNKMNNENYELKGNSLIKRIPLNIEGHIYTGKIVCRRERSNSNYGDEYLYYADFKMPRELLDLIQGHKKVVNNFEKSS